MSGSRRLEERITKLRRRAAAYRGRGNFEAAAEVEEELEELEMMPDFSDSPLASSLIEAALGVEEGLEEMEAREANRRRKR